MGVVNIISNFVDAVRDRINKGPIEELRVYKIGETYSFRRWYMDLCLDKGDWVVDLKPYADGQDTKHYQPATFDDSGFRSLGNPFPVPFGEEGNIKMVPCAVLRGHRLKERFMNREYLTYADDVISAPEQDIVAEITAPPESCGNIDAGFSTQNSPLVDKSS